MKKIYQFGSLVGIMAILANTPSIAIGSHTPLLLSQTTASELIKRAFTKLEQRNLSGAISDLDEAISMDPRNAEAYLNRGALRQISGNMQGSLSDYNQAIALKPSYLIAYRNRAELHYLMRRYKEAIADYNKLLEFNPNDAGAYYGRGLANGVQGNRGKAIEDLKKAAELYQQQGKQEDYQAALQKIQTLQQQPRNNR